VLAAYSFDQAKLRAFSGLYNDLMLADSPLSKLEREMIAVVVSAANRCYYCLVAPRPGGAPVVRRSRARRAARHELPRGEAAAPPARDARLRSQAHDRLARDRRGDRAGLRKAGFRDREIWDIAAVASFFNMTNRLASGIDMMPNEEYHSLDR
jgi:uncharacterized peroxidase-related enzyme